MILTVTPNPSLDRTVALPGRLERGAVLRSAGAIEQPGGKGVNVAAVAHAAGVRTEAIVAAGPDGAFVRSLRRAGIAAVGIDGAPEPRVNLTIAEPDGTTTKLNDAGAPLPPDGVAALERLVAERAAAADWLVLAGSLPPGVDADLYVRLAAAARRAAGGRLRVAIDTSGAPLLAVAEAGAADLLKPNAEELAELTGEDPAALEASPAAVAGAAAALRRRGTGAVLATLGAAGALLAEAAGSRLASAAPVAAVSTVGAGDASLAGYLIAAVAGDDLDGRLRRAVATGAAAVGLPGTTPPTPADLDLESVRIRAVDADDAPHSEGAQQ